MWRALALGCGIIALAGCDWDTYDPRLIHQGVGGEGGSGGAGGEAGHDGGGGGDGGAAPTCGLIDVLQDQFNDGVTDYEWETFGYGNGTATEVNGLLLDPGADDNEPVYMTYRTLPRYDLRGGHIDVRLSAIPDQSQPGAGAVYEVSVDDANGAEFVIEDNTIAVYKRVTGSTIPLMTGPYDAVAQRFLRFRETDDVFYWEVSADGAAWQELAHEATGALFPMSRIRVALGAFAENNLVSPGAAEFDSLSGGAVGGTGAWCPLGSLRDDFEDGIGSLDWFDNGSGDTVAREIGGQLVITLPPDADAFREYRSAQDYDLTESALTLEVAEVTSAPSSTYVQLIGDDARFIIRVITNMMGNLQIEAVVAPPESSEEVLNTASYDDTRRFWRIREESGLVHFDTSPDGVSWSELGSKTLVFPIDAMSLLFGSSSQMTATEPGQTIFDNVNVLP